MPPSGRFELKDFSAIAPGRSKPILNGLNVLVKQGDVVAILGPSASGKSTLAKCLLGIWPNVEGKLLLDDRSVFEYDHQQLGPHVGYLPQDVELFEGSVDENIARFGELDSAAIIKAAQKVGIHDLILKFPQGYDTPIGIAGSRLSGGQRQLIGLARAIYGNPSIIVLDEPNANLDDAGEKALNHAVLEFRKNGATVFLITHTKNVLEVVDNLLVLEQGQLLAYGPKQDILPRLMAQPLSS
jgi:ATP-binding cassette subfamily C exporter for protease/lipase